MARINLKRILVSAVFAVFFTAPLWAGVESCVECHLHRSVVEEFTENRSKVETLAGFHGREFVGDGQGCNTCHENRQEMGKLPDAKVCTGCHTRGKTSQGDPAMVFHAEKDHWPFKKVSCISCHKGHKRGNPEIKFLTTDVVKVCAGCHEKTFK